MKLLESMAENNELPDLCLLGTTDRKGMVNAARQLVAKLYDPKEKYIQYHTDLGSLRTQLAKDKDIALTKLPPSEASFEQHVLRASLQTRIWTSSHLTHPDIPSPVGHGWIYENHCVVPLFFEGKTATEFLDGLLCTCRDKNRCSKDCSCVRNNIQCTEQCLCKAGNICKNEFNG